LRQEAGDKLRVTIISPGFVRTDFAESMTNPEVKVKIPGTNGRDGDRAGCDCPRYCVRDRAAGRC
jgi:NAD(P)-dependent dehydrogenase (short-subunit alcohol dehydrogenase family)